LSNGLFIIQLAKIINLSNKKYKICFIVGTLTCGGTERQLYNYLKSLIPTEFSPYVLCLTKGDYWEEKIVKLGFPIIHTGSKKFVLYKLFKLFINIRRINPDIIYSTHFFVNAYAGLIGRILNIPIIGSVRSDFFSEIDALNFLYKKFAVRYPSVLIANSKKAIENIKHLYNNLDIRLVNNFVDNNKFYFVPKKESNRFIILTVGRLTHEKRHDRFINIIKSIINSVGNQYHIVGVIAGSGRINENLELKLKEQAKKLGLGDNNLKFLGSVDDIENVYRNSDLLLLSSKFEGSPNCVLEAMASGLPVISTKVGSIPEIIKHGESGFVIDPYDEDEFVSYILNIIHNKELKNKLGISGQSIIEKNFLAKNFNDNMKQILIDILPK